MRMLENPLSYVENRCCYLDPTPKKRESPFFFIAPTGGIPSQVRDSPELHMEAGVDDSFKSRQQQFVFFSLWLFACITSVFTGKWLTYWNTFEIQSLSLYRSNWPSSSKAKKNAAGMLPNIAEVPEGQVTCEILQRKARGPVSGSPLVWELARHPKNTTTEQSTTASVSRCFDSDRTGAQRKKERARAFTWP